MTDPARRLVVGPFNRVEGDLEVRLEVEAGQVVEARVNSTLYRGFEQLLLGKDPADALVYTPRICGICSVAQSVAAAAALADLAGVEPSVNGRLANRLIAAVENLADHFTHFYLFFMPDFAREGYADRDWYPVTGSRYRALEGGLTAQVVTARSDLLRCMGLLAGKWPHSLAIQPGGSTRGLSRSEILRLGAALSGFRKFLERHTFGADLESVLALDSLAALDAWRAAGDWQSSDLRHFLHLSDSLGLDRLGRAYDRFLCFGAYAGEDGWLFPRGTWDLAPHPLDPARISEDTSHAWLGGSATPLHPANGVTLPDTAGEQAYTWCKAPRLDGQAMETGALARQMVAGNPLIQDWVAQRGGSVAARVLARLLEMARVVVEAQSWLGLIRPTDAFCVQHGPLPDGNGAGLTEAARGSLGHWIEVRNGLLFNYQIIAPTTWNFSPRDRHEGPGALEQALVGAPVGATEKTPLAVQHVVRSFDPCMVCTVH